MNQTNLVIGDAMAKISAFFVFLFGICTKKAAQMHRRKITPKERKNTVKKTSATTRRDSKTAIDFSAASNNSLDQQTNQDGHTEILSLKDLTYSSDWYEDDVVPDHAVYQAPFDSGDKDKTVTLAELKTQELHNELRVEMKSKNGEIRDQVDGIRDEMKTQIVEMQNQIDEIRDEMKAQIQKAVEQITEIIQRTEKV